MPDVSPEKITITRVAQEAGVAVGTVSRVLNNFTDVNETVREKVMAAVQKLNYSRLRRRKANASGGNRGTHASVPRNIAVVCFGMEDTLVQLPVVSAALQEIESTISAVGGSLMLANIPRADRVPAFLEDGRVDGVILKGPNQGELPPHGSNQLLNQLYRMPHVWLMGRLKNATGDHCNFDTEEAGRLAAAHFVGKGHRRLAFLNPKPGQTQFERVKHAFISHAALLGATVDLLESEPPAAVRMWPLPAITSVEKVDTLIARWAGQSQRATAIFVPSDRTALQTYAALGARGMQAGRDVSLISCNNEQSIISGLHPRLTTIDVHPAAIGARAVAMLLWRIANRNEPLSQQLLVQPTLVEGDSVTKPE